MSDSELKYKGFTGSVEYSLEDHLLFGSIQGIRDKVTYEGDDVRSLETNFTGSVDEYLLFCKQLSKTAVDP